MILVTGASGLLGAGVVLRAVAEGREVAGLCHTHPVKIPGAQMMAVDLTDPRATADAVRRLRPAGILHCAAATNVDWCELHPRETELINVAATATLARTAGETGARFIYVSTDAVFDGARGNYSETDEPAPLNVYARAKLRGEQESVKHHPACVLARVNIYGWNAQDKYSLAEWMLALLSAGKPVPGFVDVVFSPTLVEHSAAVLLQMLDRPLSGIYHVVGSERISKFEFGRRLASEFGFDPAQVLPTRCAEARLTAARPLDVSLNVTKVEAALGRRMPGVDAGLQRFRQQREEGYPQRLKSYAETAL